MPLQSDRFSNQEKAAPLHAGRLRKSGKMVSKTRLATLAGSLGLTAALGMGALLPGVAAADAQKAALFSDARSNCATGNLTQGIPQSGFAIINATSDTIIAEVHLTNAPPNAQYIVSLDQTPSAFGCSVPIGTLQTNAQGIGNFQADVPRQPGTEDALIILRPGNAAALGTGEIDSQDVVFAAQ